MDFLPFEHHPQPSRNWEDEDDEDDGAPPSQRVYFSPVFVGFSIQKGEKKDIPIYADMLIIGTKGVGQAFIQAHFNEEPIVGSIFLPEVSLKGAAMNSSQNEMICFLRRIQRSTKNIIVAPIPYSVSQERCKSWVKCLFDNVNPECTIMLSSIQETQYTKHGENMEALSLSLLSVAMKSHDDGQRLTQHYNELQSPNFLTGIPAACLSHNQMGNGKCACITNIEPTGGMDIDTIKSFEDVFIYFGLELATTPKYGEEIRKNSKHSSVYL